MGSYSYQQHKLLKKIFKLFSEGADFIEVSTELSVSTNVSQKTETCASVSVKDDGELEGDEDLSVCLSSVDFGAETVFPVQGGEILNVVIEDDEGIIS